VYPTPGATLLGNPTDANALRRTPVGEACRHEDCR
jgi:hypothetical protein